MTITNTSESTWRAVYSDQLQSILSSTALKIRLGFEPTVVAMSHFNMLIDEYDVDFDNTCDHAALRWREMVSGACESLSARDRQTVQASHSWESVTEDIQEKAADQKHDSTTRRILMGLQPLPRTLYNLCETFTLALDPHEIELNIIWGLLFLIIKVDSHTNALRLSNCAVLTSQAFDGVGREAEKDSRLAHQAAADYRAV